MLPTESGVTRRDLLTLSSRRPWESELPVSLDLPPPRLRVSPFFRGKNVQQSVQHFVQHGPPLDLQVI
jgi:hypothetical protein